MLLIDDYTAMAPFPKLVNETRMKEKIARLRKKKNKYDNQECELDWISSQSGGWKKYWILPCDILSSSYRNILRIHVCLEYMREKKKTYGKRDKKSLRGMTGHIVCDEDEAKKMCTYSRMRNLSPSLAMQSPRLLIVDPSIFIGEGIPDWNHEPSQACGKMQLEEAVSDGRVRKKMEKWVEYCCGRLFAEEQVSSFHSQSFTANEAQT